MKNNIYNIHNWLIAIKLVSNYELIGNCIYNKLYNFVWEYRLFGIAQGKTHCR